ncbi:MAG TPA: hypothetical protein VGI38_05475 [Puia sp.]|jgi:hypothetical protein
MQTPSVDTPRNAGNNEANSLYPMKVWLTALFLVAPLCLWIENRIIYGNIKVSQNDLFRMPLLGLGGAVLSLPVYLILFLVFRYLTRKQVPSEQVRWILNAICVMGIFITFKLVDESPVLITPVCYSISVIIASLFFRIYSSQPLHLFRHKG